MPEVRLRGPYSEGSLDIVIQTSVLVLVPLILSSCLALDNGLALTPPMGWLTWLRFECIEDCKNRPNECISENLIKRTADRMVSDGYLAAGYNYVGIDDCWMERERGPDGRLVPHKKRFPSGMKALADYLHSKGLKFALYQDYGTKTCQGYPGVLGHEELDVKTFVEWDVDYIKLDGCYSDHDTFDQGYPAFGKLLNESGRPIVYSCSWPAYLPFNHTNYPLIKKSCNLWRNYGDISNSWSAIRNIMDWSASKQDELVKYAGPGNWNDPDMLTVGNDGVTLDQAKAQMAVWAILAAPLLMSTDLDTIRPEFKEILLNEVVIAVNQDRLGKQGLRVLEDDSNHLEIWNRELYHGKYAVAFVSRREEGEPAVGEYSMEDMKLPKNTYYIMDIFEKGKNAIMQPNERFRVEVNNTGVKFYMFITKKLAEFEDKESEDKSIVFEGNNDIL